MTVTATSRKNQFTTNGVTTEFTFDFAITDTSQVYAYTVVDDVETEYTDFTVEKSDDVEGGVLTTGTALSGVDLLIYRDVAITQQVDYESGGKFPADSHEQALDKLTLQNQDQQEELDRTLKTSISNQDSYEVGNLIDGRLLVLSGSKVISYRSTDIDAISAEESAIAAEESAKASELSAQAAATSKEESSVSAQASAGSAQSASESAQSASNDADRAEISADSAALNSGVYDSTTSGLTGTDDGDYFSVVSADDEDYLNLYKNNGGNADLQKTYPSASTVTGVKSDIDSIETGTFNTRILNEESAALDFTDADQVVALSPSSKKALTLDTENGELMAVNTKDGVIEFDSISSNYSSLNNESVDASEDMPIIELSVSENAYHLQDENGGFFKFDTVSNKVKTSYAIEQNLPSAADIVQKVTEEPIINRDIDSELYKLSNRPYQGTSSITKSGDRLWLAWRAALTTDGESEGNFFVLGYSDDNGETVTEVNILTFESGEVQAVDPMLWTDPEGKVWLFFGSFKGHGDEAFDSYGTPWAMVMNNPLAEIPNWSKPIKLGNWGDPRQPSPMGTGFILPIDGWQHDVDEFPNAYPDHVGANAFNLDWRNGAVEFISQLPPNHLSSPPRYWGFFETCIAQLSDGRLLATNRPWFPGLVRCYSDDGGKTWSDFQTYTDVLGLVSASRIWLGTLPSGRLAIVYNNDNVRKTLTLAISDDDGDTFPYTVLVDPDQTYSLSYPILCADGDNIWITYDVARTSQAQIKITYIKESEVISGTSAPVVNIVSDPNA